MTERPYRVSVIGAGAASAEEAALAEELGRALGEMGCILVTGGLGGVMEAASRGCSEAGGMVLGILPGPDATACNAWVSLPLATGLGESRNALVVRCGEAAVAVGGRWGTLSEIGLARKMGRRVAVLGEPSFDLGLPRLADPREAAAWALREAEMYRRTGSAAS